MKNKLKIFLFPLIILLALFNSCQKVDSNPTTSGGIDGDWTLVSWSENGVSQPTGSPQVPLSQLEITLSITDGANGTGTMTFNSSVGQFNYTGSYSLDANNLLTATLNETTGSMEINQWIMSMNATIGPNDLKLDGSMVQKSPFYPDTTTAVIFEATRYVYRNQGMKEKRVEYSKV